MLQRGFANFSKLFSNRDRLELSVIRGPCKYALDPEDFWDFPFESGDELKISPLHQKVKLHQTPDGHLHISLIPGNSIRIPPTMILNQHKGYHIPEHLCVLTGAGTETLDPIGKIHIENYIKQMGIFPEMTFLEIGCGIGRDVFQLIPILNNTAKYIGIDVTYDSILWLKKNITSSYPHFTFHHFDAKHELYNPLGSKTSFDFKLPVTDQSIDRIALGSVFTHLFEAEIVHYMKEIQRVLKPQGLCYATFFLYANDAIEASRAKSVTPFNLRFEHPYGPGCFVNDCVYKTGAVSYTEEAILRMIRKAGLKLIRPLVRGSWSGLFPESTDGQDVAILGV